MNPSHFAALDILTSSQRELVMDLFQELMDSERTDLYKVDMSDEESEQIVRKCQPDQKDIADRCREPCKNVVIMDQDDRLLLVYKPDFMPKPIVKSTEDAIEDLLSKIRLELSSDDYRRMNVDQECLMRKYGQGRYGVLYCAYWMERTKPDEPPVVSSKLTATRHANHYCVFAQGMKNIKERLGLLYAAADPSRWRHCVDVFRSLRHYLPTSQLLSTSDIDPWISMVLVANVPTNIHRDRNDSRTMLSGIMAIGGLPHQWLVIPSVRLKLKINPRNAILANTRVLAHFVHSEATTNTEDMDTRDMGTKDMGTKDMGTKDTEGMQGEDADEEEIEEQYIMSFFNHQRVQDWVRNEAAHRAEKGHS